MSLKGLFSAAHETKELEENLKLHGKDNLRTTWKHMGGRIRGQPENTWGERIRGKPKNTWGRELDTGEYSGEGMESAAGESKG